MSRPIEARVDFGNLAERLTRRAEALAEAHAESRKLAAQGNETRWRRAALVWPLFAKG